MYKLGKIVGGLHRGRIGRLAYFAGTIEIFLISFIPLFIVVSVWGLVRIVQNASSTVTNEGFVFNLVPLLISLSLLFSAIFFLYGLTSITVRRFHDFGQSGWWAALLFIPYLNLLLFIFLILKSGNTDQNKYGPLSNRGTHAEIFNLEDNTSPPQYSQRL